jgi:hypothetical protein
MTALHRAGGGSILTDPSDRRWVVQKTRHAIIEDDSCDAGFVSRVKYSQLLTYTLNSTEQLPLYRRRWTLEQHLDKIKPTQRMELLLAVSRLLPSVPNADAHLRRATSTTPYGPQSHERGP